MTARREREESFLFREAELKWHFVYSIQLGGWKESHNKRRRVKGLAATLKLIAKWLQLYHKWLVSYTQQSFRVPPECKVIKATLEYFIIYPSSCSGFTRSPLLQIQLREEEKLCEEISLLPLWLLFRLSRLTTLPHPSHPSHPHLFNRGKICLFNGISSGTIEISNTFNYVQYSALLTILLLQSIWQQRQNRCMF